MLTPKFLFCGPQCAESVELYNIRMSGAGDSRPDPPRVCSGCYGGTFGDARILTPDSCWMLLGQ